jgi:uncharacterized delta-60 repeat protein
MSGGRGRARRKVGIALAAACVLVSAMSFAAAASTFALDGGFGYGGIAGVAMGGGVGFSIAVQPGTGRVLEMGEGDNVLGVQRVLQAVAFTSTGSLDTTYASNGAAQIDLSSLFVSLYPTGGTMLASGRVILTGYGLVPHKYEKFDGVIAGLRVGGRLDPSFGDGGIVTIRTSGFDVTHIFGSAEQPNGKIVLAGEVEQTYGGAGRPAIWRLLADGRLDPSFANGGLKLMPARVGVGTLAEVAMAPSGRIVASGRVFAPDGHYRATVIAVTSDGQLDDTFNNHGYVREPFGHGEWSSESDGVAIGSNGAVFDVASLQSLTNGFTITKYRSDGVINTNFNNGQPIYYNPPVVAQSIAIDQQGRILTLVKGQGGYWTLFRYARDGTGPDGLSLVYYPPDLSTPSELDLAKDVSIGPDGSYYIAGQSGAIMSAAHVVP